MSEADFRRSLRAVMARERMHLLAALRGVLAKGLEGESRHVQLEVDPWSLSVRFCPLDEELLPDDWVHVPGDWPDEFDEILTDELFPWLASCWADAGGGSAFAFWHGFEARFDLQKRAWLPRLD